MPFPLGIAYRPADIADVPGIDRASRNSTGRIAVLGLYNSGSTVLAGVLHRMGVDMGGPFWATSEEGHPQNFYEPTDLSDRLRMWWAEPFAVELANPSERVEALRSWIQQREAARAGWVGAKHPLLSLCA